MSRPTWSEPQGAARGVTNEGHCKYVWTLTEHLLCARHVNVCEALGRRTTNTKRNRRIRKVNQTCCSVGLLEPALFRKGFKAADGEAGRQQKQMSKNKGKPHWGAAGCAEPPRPGAPMGGRKEEGCSLVSGHGLVVPQITDPVQAPTSTRRAGVPRQICARQRSVCAPPLHPSPSTAPRGCRPARSRTPAGGHSVGGSPCMHGKGVWWQELGAPGLRGLGVGQALPGHECVLVRVPAGRHSPSS